MTFLRECVAADFFVDVDLCVLEEEEDVFFFLDDDVDDEALSCASRRSPGTSSVQTRVVTRRRLRNIVVMQFSAIGLSEDMTIRVRNRFSGMNPKAEQVRIR